MDIIGTSQNLRPLSLLSESNCCDSIHLQVFSNSVSWSIYLEQGKIIYASHSVAPFDRLDCHLRRLNHQTPISKIIEIRTQLHQMSLKLDAPKKNSDILVKPLNPSTVESLDTNVNEGLTKMSGFVVTQSVNQLLPDYEAIIWLVRQEYITSIQASTLIEGLTREVIESFLLLKKGTYKLGNKLKTTPIICRLEVQPILECCQKNLKLWQTLAPHIFSPYQRPYFLSQNRIKSDLSLEIRQKLSAMLKGFSFYHLAVILNQDKLQLAQSLYPYIKDGAVLLHDPNPPFNQLPKTFVQFSKSPVSLENLSPTLRNNGSEGGAVDKLQTPMESATPTRTVMFGVPYSSPTKGTHKIVCVDDSPTVLREINYFLNDDSFSVVPISDPVKALMQIIRVKPDLILLDIGMPELDGYELCRLLRNHSRFKNTPIIMVTGSTGILDRVKAKFVGSSGYLAKPFDKAKLLKTMFKHLD